MLRPAITFVGAVLALPSVTSAALNSADDFKTASAALAPFTDVCISVPADLELLNDARFSYTISAESKVINAVSFKLDGQKLVVQANKDFDTQKPIKITVRMPQLARLEALGSVNVSSKVPTAPASLELTLDGASSLQIAAVQSRLVGVEIAGSGSVQMVGQANKLVLKLHGSADADLKQLKTQDAEITIAGSGDVKLAVARSLAATISGAGDIDYIGQPRVTSHITGAGEVKRIR